ncbi:hypothetical protein [Sphingosinithalassobacter sp. CS137]|uniref:hypothetical protein n=1 Tax=Sphingosinithalassobacter sp. CS137 TaxID=2762748 RepID=UPI00165E36C6|nr:hypothetical protein [Sphingosinithalassobacter sp. CS137]
MGGGAPAPPPVTVRPELVEGLHFFEPKKEEQGFDKLSPHGLGWLDTLEELNRETPRWS